MESLWPQPLWKPLELSWPCTSWLFSPGFHSRLESLGNSLALSSNERKHITMTTNGQHTATVETLTAEVRVLMALL